MAIKLSALYRALPLVLAGFAAAPAIAAEIDFDGALQSYRSGRMSEAYGRMLTLGLKGDADAARVALFMGENGAVVYGTLWELRDLDAAKLRESALRPSLRPRPLADMADYDATGVTQAPPRAQELAVK